MPLHRISLKFVNQSKSIRLCKVILLIPTWPAACYSECKQTLERSIMHPLSASLLCIAKMNDMNGGSLKSTRHQFRHKATSRSCDHLSHAVLTKSRISCQGMLLCATKSRHQRRSFGFYAEVFIDERQKSTF